MYDLSPEARDRQTTLHSVHRALAIQAAIMHRMRLRELDGQLTLALLAARPRTGQWMLRHRWALRTWQRLRRKAFPRIYCCTSPWSWYIVMPDGSVWPYSREAPGGIRPKGAD